MIGSKRKSETEHVAMGRVSRRSFIGGGAIAGASLVLPPFAAAAAKSAALPENDASWEHLRAGFDLDPELTYLNTGTLGALSRRVRETRAKAELDFAHDPAHFQVGALLDGVRRGLATLTSGDPDEIAITRNTTEGLNLFASGLDLRPGDEVVLGSEEHNSAFGAYQGVERRAGIKIVQAKLAVGESLDRDAIVDAYRKAITPRTRVLVASQVAYRTGIALPLKELAELAHSRGLLISVDGAQGFSVLPLNVRALNLDHYAAPGHKWLLAGAGTGFTWVRRDLQARIRPTMGDYDPESRNAGDQTARRYEKTGQRNLTDLSGFADAIDAHAAIGTERIAARIRELSARLRTGLHDLGIARIYTPSGAGLSAGITSFSLRDLPAQKVGDALRARRVIVRVVPLGDEIGIRVSTHFYNRPADVDRLLALLRDFAAKPALLG
ncbi:aminotransferase class V-fold PLP-dependent enzyme [Steroidobacter cummioxidans]|uniref:aminotransferase class V-fold PLP-dependent enzyme n=1 Tax=Steroidobacter cummioxidans TaxID=1803913 RepID=UPI000E310E8E|nr:aminotransferase class V-fold PLP-dependent enzyme [Steroidobacter cummioxidans]